MFLRFEEHRLSISFQKVIPNCPDIYNVVLRLIESNIPLKANLLIGCNKYIVHWSHSLIPSRITFIRQTQRVET